MAHSDNCHQTLLSVALVRGDVSSAARPAAGVERCRAAAARTRGPDTLLRCRAAAAPRGDQRRARWIRHASRLV